jgi:hypothetical protein
MAPAPHLPNYLVHGDLSDWKNVGEDGTYMLTAQNKSISNLTLTGTFYYAPAFIKNAGTNGADIDANVLWGDAAYKNDDMPVTFGLQGGYLDANNVGFSSTKAWGAKIGGHWGAFS